jgi:N-acetylglucosamine kinase-like BadF-type ATPase
MNKILLADSGSSKTDWVILENNKIGYSFQSIGINPYFWTFEQIVEEIWANVVPQVGEKEIEYVFFYGAGCSNETKKNLLRAALHEVFRQARVEIFHDLLAAARALCGKENGIACILGTGSNACVFENGEITAQPINLGFWLGDEGSGGYLGKSLVLAFLHQEMPEKLQKAFQEIYMLDTEIVLENTYQKPFPNRYFASFAPFCEQFRQEPFIAELIEKNFDLFLSKYILKLPKVNLYPVHCVGSIAVVFEQIWRNCLQKHKLIQGKTLKSPIQGLVEFHKCF